MNDTKKTASTPASSTRRNLIVGAGIAFGGFALSPVLSRAVSDDGISRTAEAIHQEPVFTASRKRVYEALTDAAQFHKVTLLSDAMRSGMAPGMRPTEISKDPGSAFVLFGGYITGRQLELVPNERIVQAWRAGWAPGDYSIVRFELADNGSGTKIVFNQAAFPQGKAESLARGWKANYWEPLEKFLSQA